MGAQQQFTATAHLSDGNTKDVTSSVRWSSSDSNIASIAAGGLATGSAFGTVTITAQSGTLEATAALRVSAAAENLISIAISPAAPSIPVHTSQQFTATGNFSDGSTQDITLNSHWSSSAATVATIANAPSVAGVANCSAAGTATIGSNSGGVAGSAVLTVQ
jgi:hypothetical protein